MVRALDSKSLLSESMVCLDSKQNETGWHLIWCAVSYLMQDIALRVYLASDIYCWWKNGEKTHDSNENFGKNGNDTLISPIPSKNVERFNIKQTAGKLLQFNEKKEMNIVVLRIIIRINFVFGYIRR